MNYGPLEFAAYLGRRGTRKEESAEVTAARAAAPRSRPGKNSLSVIAGSGVLSRLACEAQVEAVSVYEAMAMHPPGVSRNCGPVRVLVRPALRSIVPMRIVYPK